MLKHENPLDTSLGCGKGKSKMIISIRDKDVWNDNLRYCSSPRTRDIYHTHEYHLLAKKCGHGEPFLFVVPNICAIPLLINMNRATSVYGYPGPTYGDGQFFHTSIKKRISEELLADLWKMGITELETRLHPLIPADQVLGTLCKCERVGTTVAIDMNSETLRLRDISKGHRHDIEKAKKAGIVVKQDLTLEEFDKFIEFYHQTMARVGADNRYFFDGNYFDLMRKLLRQYIGLFLAKLKDEIVSAAIFFFYGNFINYHLSGTPNEHTSCGGAKVIIEHVANLIGFSRWLHLGGGVGSSEDDPLWTFKKGFSKNRLPFCVAKWRA